MQSDQHHAVKVLNSLIETTLDSAHGYREAAENVQDQNLRSMFEQRAQRRRELVGRLQQEVRTFGGTPQDDQSMVGKMHNKFVDLKAAMGADSNKSIIAEVERGEDVIKGKYEHAAKDDDLPTPCRDMVRQACEMIRADHDEISAMKHRLQ